VTRLDEMFEGLPPRLSMDELADLLGIDAQTAYRWVQQGKVPAYKVSRSWVILRDEVKDFLAANSNRPPRAPSAPAQRDAQG